MFTLVQFIELKESFCENSTTKNRINFDKYRLMFDILLISVRQINENG